MNKKLILTGASVSLLVAIGLGAMGAHGLKPLINAEALESYKTGVDYQIYHGLAILILLAIGHQFELKYKWAIRFMFIGTLLFSGSIYLLALRPVLGIESWSAVLGPITPIGGLCFMTGWVLVIITSLKLNK